LPYEKHQRHLLRGQLRVAELRTAEYRELLAALRSPALPSAILTEKIVLVDGSAVWTNLRHLALPPRLREQRQRRIVVREHLAGEPDGFRFADFASRAPTGGLYALVLGCRKSKHGALFSGLAIV
jgi:hypothetical protein